MMFQSKLTKTASLALACILMGTSSTFAQSVIWGAGHTDPHIDSVGRFASPDSTFASMGWVNTSIYCTNINGQPSTPSAWTRDSSCTTALWAITYTGRGRGALRSTITPMASPSVADGAAIFDADYLTNAGNGTPTVQSNTGPAPDGYNTAGTRLGHQGTLTSPFIDMTGHQNTSMVLQMYSRLEWLNGYADMFRKVGVSIDGGLTWTDFNVATAQAVNGPAQPTNNKELIDISSAFTTAAIAANPNADLTQCLLKFSWAGGYYYWIIDDLSILPKPSYEIAIGPGTGAPNAGSFATYNVVRVSNNRYQPLSQVSAEEYKMGGHIHNYGSQAILPSNHARLVVRINQLDGAGVPTVVHMDSINVDSLPADSSVVVTKQLNWLPTAVANYSVQYWVRMDSADANVANDSFTHSFTITDNYYSKARKNATDGGPNSTTALGFPVSANPVDYYEPGTMFFFPHGTQGPDTVTLDSVICRVYSPSNTRTSITEFPVTIFVQEFLANGTVSDDDFTTVGIGFDTVPVNRGQYSLFTAPIIDVNGNPAVYLRSGKIYYVSLRQSNPAGVDSSICLVGVESNPINFDLNSDQALDSAIFPMLIRFTTVGTTTPTFFSGFNNAVPYAPSMGLFITFDHDTAVGTVALNPEATNFTIYPNPTKDVLNVNVTLEQQSASVQYIMTDISGRVVRLMTRRNVQSEIVSFPVEDLTSGVYMISIVTDKGVSTKKFIKE